MYSRSERQPKVLKNLGRRATALLATAIGAAQAVQTTCLTSPGASITVSCGNGQDAMVQQISQQCGLSINTTAHACVEEEGVGFCTGTFGMDKQCWLGYNSLISAIPKINCAEDITQRNCTNSYGTTFDIIVTVLIATAIMVIVLALGCVLYSRCRVRNANAAQPAIPQNPLVALNPVNEDTPLMQIG